MRRSFSLIELIVAVLILALAASGLFLGLHRSIRTVRIQSSKERLEQLFMQAFRFSSISGHVSDVIISKRPDGWIGELTLWGKDSSDITLLARNCEAISRLPGVLSAALNGREISGASFRFFGSHGLVAVCAFDQYGEGLSEEEVRFFRDVAASRVEPELVLTLFPTPNPTPVEELSLKAYFITALYHPPFPNELIQT